jgi:micrococcal nuclease
MNDARRVRVALLLAAVLAALLLALPVRTPTRAVTGTVTRVADGDTLTLVTAEGTKIRVRLYGIDAPEVRRGRQRGQPHGGAAKLALEEKVIRRQVRVEVLDKDRYRRSVGVVYSNGRDINAEMVREGHAWAFREYLERPYASEYIRAEEEARRARRGLWAENNPKPPREFRRGQRSR